MMRLAARHADLWNGCWFGGPGSLGDVLSRIRAGCRQEGRDPATLGLTLGVNVDVGEDLAERGHPVLAGTPRQVADGLLAYRELGIAHLICNLNPHDQAAQRRLAAAVRLYRKALEPAERTG